ncbi:unnamed protein product [Vitrella brassicaformis CCMP3155]|uniref:endo-1,4-beta-xylanase n=1 Tax=Vitrella brassicaformis (strain CCMP3155) TaxID=1169540 RepID=A0A0G4GB25_VITBC|nr:unnamed protein product [Vitrella brassicaformis CCMP3155]|eukprot:CEM26350.1 unnamed protein product [Vitrella brassicaformis CCMP3155]
MQLFWPICASLAVAQLFADAQESVFAPEEQVFLLSFVDATNGRLLNALPLTSSPFPLPANLPDPITILFQPDPEHIRGLPPIVSVDFTVTDTSGENVFHHQASLPPYSLFPRDGSVFEGAAKASRALRVLQEASDHSFLLDGDHTLEAAVLRDGDASPTIYTVNLTVDTGGSSPLTNTTLALTGIQAANGESSSQWVGSLKAAAAKAGIAFGSVICQAPLDAQNNPRCRYGGEAAYQQIVKEELGVISAERECKWWTTRTDADLDNIAFDACEQIFRLAKANGQKARFHTLLWYMDVNYGNVGVWLPTLSAADKRNQLVGHIERMVERFRTPEYPNLIHWDVVNEALDDFQDADQLRKGGYRLRDTVWYPDIPEFIDLAFVTASKAAKAADALHDTPMPPMKLIYNEYWCESADGYSAGKSDALYNLMKGMKRRAIPVDGVGFQSHVTHDYDLFDGIRANMRRLGALGLEVQFTELDVSCGRWEHVGAPEGTGNWIKCGDDNEWGPEIEKKQADVYRRFMRVCLEEPNCTAFLTWGIVDKSTWLNRDMFRPDYPLLFDAAYRPKQSYIALRDEMLAVNQTVARWA